MHAGRCLFPSTAARAAAVLAAGHALTASLALADAGWPQQLPPGWDGRGGGGGLAIIPAVAWWLCVLGWMRTVDWVSRDATKHKGQPAFWGMVCGLPMFLAAIIAWWIPSSLGGLALMIVAWLAPTIAYTTARNKTVAPSEQVLTVGHARRIAARLLAPFGIEIATGVLIGTLGGVEGFFELGEFVTGFSNGGCDLSLLCDEFFSADIEALFFLGKLA
jgi:hypothetical protein